MGSVIQCTACAVTIKKVTLNTAYLPYCKTDLKDSVNITRTKKKYDLSRTAPFQKLSCLFERARGPYCPHGRVANLSYSTRSLDCVLIFITHFI